MEDDASVQVRGCVGVIPSANLERSLRFWVDGLGFTMDRAIRRDGRLIGCMVHGANLAFWLNEREGPTVPPGNYEGLRLYWTPRDLLAVRARLEGLGFTASPIEVRDYGQTEFFVTDDDGFSHCFGVASADGG